MALGELARERRERAGPGAGAGAAEPASFTPVGAVGSQAGETSAGRAASSPGAGAELAEWLMAGAWPAEPDAHAEQRGYEHRRGDVRAREPLGAASVACWHVWCALQHRPSSQTITA